MNDFHTPSFLACLNKIQNSNSCIANKMSSLRKLYFKNSSSGFTLLELLITISILSILIVLAYPKIIHILQTQEARKTRFIFIDSIRLARATSLSTRQRVFMCLLDNTGNCNRDDGKSIVLFYDKNHDNNFQPDIDTLINTEQLNLKFADIYLRAGRRAYVRFSADTGTPRGFFGHFKYCTTQLENNNNFKVSFNQSGITKFKPSHTEDTGCPS